MDEFAVNFADLGLAAQVLDRQAGHCDQTSRYLQEQCSIPAWDLGLLLQFLHPVNELIVDLGANIERGLGAVASGAANATRGARDDYVDAEITAAEWVCDLTAQLTGESPPPVGDPRDTQPPLGPAHDSAPSNYGDAPFAPHPLEDLVVNSVSIATDARDLVAGNAAQATERLSMYGQPGVVCERTDASSYLVPATTAQENWVEEVRSKAGVIIGGVDWVAEQFMGISILEEYVLKPFAGDWHALGRASSAWDHASAAMRASAGNSAALPGQLTSWTGQGAGAFFGTMTALSGGTLAASHGFSVVANVVDKITTVAKLAASGIATLLRKIANKLLRMAAEAAVPVVGWAVLAAEIAIMIGEIISWLGLINSLITSILDAISEAIAARETLMEVAFMVEDLVRGGATLGARSAVA